MLACSLLAMTHAVHLHVSDRGNDLNSGQASRPLKTFDGARLAARKYQGRPVIVEFEAGMYRLKHPVVFSEKDSGNVTYRSQAGTEVILSGSSEFRPQWTPYKGKILKCVTPKGFEADQLFVNGEKQTLARYPNANPAIRILQGYAKDAISPERIAKWKDPSGGYLHAMHALMWGDFHYRILGKDSAGALRMEGGWQNNRQSGMHDEYRFVEGIFEELDAPGEWFLDRKSHTLYLYPRPGTDLKNCVVEAPTLRSLIDFRGSKGLKLQGFRFQHTTRTFMDNREPLLRSDWTIYRGGAILFDHAEGCEITDSRLEELGGNAIFVDGKNRNLAIRRCVIQDVGANGVAFVGSPKAVRSPLFEYNQRQSLAQMDKAVGPKTDDYPVDCLVEDCLITRTGVVEKQTAPVEISMSRRITVRHCSIYHVPRAGINIGDGCWGGHVIEGCDVFDTVLETGDHGSFNSWGRDRYWSLTDVDMNKGEHPELANLDVVEPIVLRNNRWRCDHGWDIDLDDGSSRYVIQNNLCLSGGLKNREGFDRRVENNILVDNSFHPHVWFLNSGDVFRHNIVFTPYRPIGDRKPWGKLVDQNFLQMPSGQAGATPAHVLADQSGGDAHSLVGDAEFVNPAKGDFRVRPGSPAFSVGFKNFEMDSFGVRPTDLRAIARTPRIGNEIPTAVDADESFWLGAKVKNLVDPGEISAVGLGERLGVLVSAVEPGSEAEQLGLIPLDVIRAVDGMPVRSAKTLRGFSKVRRSLTLWRQQRPFDLRAR